MFWLEVVGFLMIVTIPANDLVYVSKPYFVGISPYTSLTYALIYGRYLDCRILEFPLMHQFLKAFRDPPTINYYNIS